MELTDIPGGRQPGFMDRELRPGHDWPRRITEALATCRVFIPLYSPRYFSSESCGKEWYAFHRRQVEHEANGGRHPEAIIPVLWVPVPDDRLPRVARSLQFDHHRLGEVYARSGFSQLIRINQYADDYRLALHILADYMVRVAGGNPPATTDPLDFNSLDCAFGSEERKRSNNRCLRITVVTDEFYRLPAIPVSRVVEYYKPNAPTQWNPYRPDSKIALAEYTANLVRGMGLVPEVQWFDDARPAAPVADIEPEIMLVDPWPTLDDDRSERLQSYLALPRPWIQVMVPWSTADTQTVLNERLLRDTVAKALLLTGPPTGPSLPSLETFGNALPKTINTVLRNYLRQAEPRPPSGARRTRPRLLDTQGGLK